MEQETKIKGYINIVGYKVVADENANPGRYAFKIIHETDKTHFFSSDEKIVVREWMKAIMKATIGRDYTSKIFVLYPQLDGSTAMGCRTGHVILQYPNNTSYGCTSYESLTATSIPNCS